MIKLKSLLLEADLPKKFYHLTRYDNLKSIRSKGLKPFGPKPWIYLTDDEFTAVNYANAYDKGTRVILLEIYSQYLDKSKLGPDDDDLKMVLRQQNKEFDWYDVPWEESLRMVSQITYKGTIPSEAIRVKQSWIVSI